MAPKMDTGMECHTTTILYKESDLSKFDFDPEIIIFIIDRLLQEKVKIQKDSF